MQRQQQFLVNFFKTLGVDEEKITSYLNAADDAETDWDEDDVYAKVLDYAKPHLKGQLKKEFSPEFKGQYMNEALNKVIAASKGKLRRADYANGDLDKAIEDFQSLSSTSAQDDSDVKRQLNELLQEKATWEATTEEKINGVKSEYEQKENSRLAYDGIVELINGVTKPQGDKPAKRMSVDVNRAAKILLRDFEEMGTVKYDRDGKKVALYSKDDPDVLYNQNGKNVPITELVQKQIIENGWLQESNGGTGKIPIGERPVPVQQPLYKGGMRDAIAKERQ